MDIVSSMIAMEALSFMAPHLQHDKSFEVAYYSEVTNSPSYSNQAARMLCCLLPQ